MGVSHSRVARGNQKNGIFLETNGKSIELSPLIRTGNDDAKEIQLFSRITDRREFFAEYRCIGASPRAESDDGKAYKFLLQSYYT